MNPGKVATLVFMIASGLVAGCGAVPLPVAAPTGPCLDDLPDIHNIASTNLRLVEMDTDGTTEVVRFVLDPTDDGFGSVTAEPARPPFFEVTTDGPIVPFGDLLTSVKFEGLTSVGQADRLRRDPGEPGTVREVVRVADRNVTRFIIGTTIGACLRLRVDAAGGTVTLLASPN